LQYRLALSALLLTAVDRVGALERHRLLLLLISILCA
jgi:hypothetical protein